jgi:hypothetical protein
MFVRMIQVASTNHITFALAFIDPISCLLTPNSCLSFGVLMGLVPSEQWEDQCQTLFLVLSY